MQKIDSKTLIITSIITLSPILIGIIFYENLPSTIAVHFNINNQGDIYWNKNLALFLIPIFMTLMQIIICLVNDLAPNNNIKNKKIEKIFKLIIPVLSILIYIILILVSLNYNINIAAIIISIIVLIVLIIYIFRNK